MIDSLYKEEVINGKTFFMSPAAYSHTKIVVAIYNTFYEYLKPKNCKVFQDNLYVILDENNKLTPDVTVVCDENNFSKRGYEGVPSLVVEVLSPSTSKLDRVDKKNIYESFGVPEYWIVDMKNKTVEQYRLTDGAYSEIYFHVSLDNDDMDEFLGQENYTQKFRAFIFPDLEFDLINIFD